MPYKKKILIAAESGSDRAMLSEILSKDYQVLEAGRGQEALQILQEYQNGISLILLDTKMPDMDGYAFLKRVKENAESALIPVVAITGCDGEADALEALAQGATDFLPKPCNPQIVLNRIAALIKLRETAAIVNLLRYDRLTGLYSREFFYQKVRQWLLENPEGECRIVCVNIENFKLVNDAFGTQEGDRLLKEVADTIRKNVGRGGFCGRFGTDRFLCFQTRRQEDTDWKFRVIGSGASPLLSGAVIRCGIYRITHRDLPIEQMCDRALLAADSIRNRFDQYLAVYDESIRNRLMREQTMLSSMMTALAEGQFVIYLQPKVSLADRRVAGAEALVRWEHPQLGFLSPGEFFPAMEKSGFITKLDRYIWEQVCVLLQAWKEKGYRIPVSVNVFRADVFRGDLIETICALTQKHGVDPSSLHLEIKESAYADNPEQIIAAAKELHDRGFLIVMDDFGSGHSCLNMLGQMPLDVLKLDTKFVHHETAVPGERSLLGDVIRMAHRLGLAVVAEGVETREQAARLEEAGCDFMQGYYFGRPMPVAEFEEQMHGWLTDSRKYGR